MAKGKHPAPFRTRKLSPSAPMVLHVRACGRVGRRRTILCKRAASGRPFSRRGTATLKHLERKLSPCPLGVPAPTRAADARTALPPARMAAGAGLAEMEVARTPPVVSTARDGLVETKVRVFPAVIKTAATAGPVLAELHPLPGQVGVGAPRGGGAATSCQRKPAPRFRRSMTARRFLTTSRAQSSTEA